MLHHDAELFAYFFFHGLQIVWHKANPKLIVWPICGGVCLGYQLEPFLERSQSMAES